MTVSARVAGFDGRLLTVEPEGDILHELLLKDVGRVELTLPDGRQLSPEQRRKIFAVIGEIAHWSGHDPEELRRLLTWSFCGERGEGLFSLSPASPAAASVTCAREFIDYLTDFCLFHGVPLSRPLLDYADDVDRYLYRCLEHRRCAVCGRPAEVHHIDRIGMGRGRESIVHEGLLAVALCREHHGEAHRGEREFFDRHHIRGVRLDGYLCKRLSLKGEGK